MDLCPALRSLGWAILAKEAQRVAALTAKELRMRFWEDPTANGQLELIDEPRAGSQRGE